jgi:uncharacterized protein (DUF305 family)
MKETMQHNHHYRALALMAGLSFLSMYALMFAMVDSGSDIYNSVNQLYMAGLMTAPMVALELLLMSGMYENKRLNGLILAGSVILGAAFFGAIRQQTAVGDRQFLRSMIPHHSGAILMCKEAPLRDSRTKELCQNIITSQMSEIEQMRAILLESQGK